MKKWMCLLGVVVVAGCILGFCFKEKTFPLTFEKIEWHQDDFKILDDEIDFSELDLSALNLNIGGRIQPVEARSIIIQVRDDGSITSPEVGQIDQLKEYLLLNGVQSSANVAAGAAEIELVVIGRKKALLDYSESISASVEGLDLEKITYSSGLLEEKFDGFGYKEGVWYFRGNVVGSPIWYLIEGIKVVKIHAAKDTEMQHFETLFSALKDREVKVKLTTLDTPENQESVTIEMLSATDKIEMAKMIDAFEKSDLLGVSDQQFKLAGIAGDVIAVNDSDKVYHYANTDGRGVKHFKSVLNQEEKNYAILGVSEKTTLSQFIKGMKIYQDSGVKSSITMNNRKAALAFSQERQEPVVDHNTADKYIPRPEDLPQDFRMPARLKLVEKKSLGLPYHAVRLASITLFLKLENNGELKLLGQEPIELEKLSEIVKERVKAVNKYDEVSVYFFVDPKADPKTFLAVLNLLKDHSITKIVFPDKNVNETQGGFEHEVSELPPFIVKPETKQIKIVLNVLNQGKITGINWREEIKNIEIYLAEQLTKYKDLKLKGNVVLHLRGTENNLMKYHHRIVRAAARVGVDRVIFSAYPAAGERE